MIRQQASSVAPAQVESALEQVFSLPEFREQGESKLSQLIEGFFEWLGDLFGGGPDVSADGLATGIEVLQWIVIGIAAVGLVWFLVKVGAPGLRRLQERRRLAAEEARLVRRVEELRRAAREAEIVHDWTRALRLHFFAAVVGLGESGELDYRDAWTNRELLERGEPAEYAREVLAPLVEELDEHSFGLRPTAAGDVQRFSDICDDLIGEQFPEGRIAEGGITEGSITEGGIPKGGLYGGDAA